MQNILVAVDFSETTEEILERALGMATAFSAKLWLVHAAAPAPEFIGYDAGPQTVRNAVAAEFREEHRRLQELAAGLRNRGVTATAILAQGATVEAVLEEAEKLEVDLIVLGASRHGALHRVLQGSVSEGVIRQAPCPLLLVPVPRGIADRPAGAGPDV